MSMESAFTYQNGYLCADVVPLQEIVTEYGTPLLVINEKRLQHNALSLVHQYNSFGITPHYSVRTNGLPLIVRTLSEYGYTLKASTIEELYRLLNSGVPPENISVTGAGKTIDYISASILANINTIEISSFAEIDTIARISNEFGITSSVSIVLDIATESVSYHDGLPLDDLAIFIKQLARHKTIHLKGLCLSSTLSLPTDSCSKMCTSLSAILHILRDNGLYLTTIDLNNVFDHMQDLSGLNDSLAFTQTAFSSHTDLSVTAAAAKDIVNDSGAMLTTISRIETARDKRLLFVDLDNDSTLKLEANTRPISALPVFQNKTDTLTIDKPASIFSNNKPVSLDTLYLSSALESDILAIIPAGTLYSAGNTNCVVVSGANRALVGRRMSEIERMTYETAPEWMEADRVA